MGISKTEYRKVSEFPAYVKELSLKADGDEELVDLLGTVNSTETALASIRQGAAAELPAGTEGRQWRMVQGKTAQRSYNDSHLIAKFCDYLERTFGGEWTPFQAIGWLREHGVLKFSWHWTNLKKAANTVNMPLTVAPHEIESGDIEIDVGENWKYGYPKYEAKGVE